uniref:Acidic PLA2 PA4 n=1 Tax=Nemopilema nomurai TaxID=321803 RepID=A0A1D8GZE6_9CNID|nr:acidic phospholipase A2 PA4 [Nemopilema nomurai]AOT85613.1 acidic PLA2 PA4 [Nemopilema nomurai]
MKLTVLLLLVAVQVFADIDELHELEKSTESESRSEAFANTDELNKRIIMPGTLWCGMANKTKHDNDLGEYADVDSRCRAHYKCDRKVFAFSKKYGYRNWKPYTLSDCVCDEDYYNCLKDVKENKQPALLVGKLFFNILQVPCLRFNADGLKATKEKSKFF